MHFLSFHANMHRMSDTIFLAGELGKALEQRRIAAGLTIQALARRAGKSRAVVYRLERGEESSVSSLLAVAAALGVSFKLETAGLPTLRETAGFFDEEDDDAS